MLLNFKCLIKVRVIRFHNQPEALYHRFSSSIFCLNDLLSESVMFIVLSFQISTTLNTNSKRHTVKLPNLLGRLKPVSE